MLFTNTYNIHLALTSALQISQIGRIYITNIIWTCNQSNGKINFKASIYKKTCIWCIVLEKNVFIKLIFLMIILINKWTWWCKLWLWLWLCHGFCLLFLPYSVSFSYVLERLMQFHLELGHYFLFSHQKWRIRHAFSDFQHFQLPSSNSWLKKVIVLSVNLSCVWY